MTMHILLGVLVDKTATSGTEPCVVWLHCQHSFFMLVWHSSSSFVPLRCFSEESIPIFWSLGFLYGSCTWWIYHATIRSFAPFLVLTFSIVQSVSPDDSGHQRGWMQHALSQSCWAPACTLPATWTSIINYFEFINGTYYNDASHQSVAPRSLKVLWFEAVLLSTFQIQVKCCNMDTILSVWMSTISWGKKESSIFIISNQSTRNHIWIHLGEALCEPDITHLSYVCW